MAKCFNCGRHAHNIQEYHVQIMGDAEITDDNGEFVRYDEAKLISADEWVRENEGTYNAETDEFCCTPCYIRIGMPSRDIYDPLGGWKAGQPW